jgi:hypothetical protein
MNVTKYKFAAKFEQAIVQLLLFVPDFWKRIGKEIEPKALDDPILTLITEATLSICADRNRPPKNVLTVAQRLSRWHSEGKITKDMLELAGDRIDYLEDLDLCDLDEIVDELVPIIKQRKNHAIIRDGAKLLANKQSMSSVIKDLQRIDTLGRVVRRRTLGLDDEAFDAIEAASKVQKLRLLTDDFDRALNGGVQAKTMSVILANTNVGKTSMLVHFTGVFLIQKYNVLYATLEETLEQLQPRIFANLTGVPSCDISSGTQRQLSKDRMKCMDLGAFQAGEFESGTTKVQDLIDWTDEMEEEFGVKFNVLMIDYADKLGHSQKKKYDGLDEIYTGLIDQWAKRRNGWVWSASQARRIDPDKKGKIRRVTINDFADSHNKARLAHFVLGVNGNKDEYTCTYEFLKNRESQANMVVTFPVQTDISGMAPVCKDGKGPTEDDFDLF